MKIRNKLSKTVITGLFIGLSSVSFTGCISATAALGIDTTNHKEQDEAFLRGDYNTSAALAYESKDHDAELDTSNLLHTLKAGNSYLFNHDYAQAVEMFDDAENIMKHQHEESILGSTSDYVAKLLLNDAAVNFQASMTSGIMVNTYKAVSYMADNKFPQARIELNRALDRQRRAKEEYAKLIAKQKEAIAEEKAKGKKIDEVTTRKIVNQHYSNLDSFEAYPDFVNPFTTYLAGLYFHLSGDNTKSIDLLKEASAMSPANKVVASDFQMVNEALSGNKTDKQYVWVIFDNGLGPIKKEVRVDIPVFLVSNKVSYVGIALPNIATRTQAYPFLEISSNNTKEKTEIVGEMDRVAMTEFKYGFNYIVTRAILSATLKAYAQYYASENAGAYAGLAMGLLSAATTRADIRAWSTLPKDFQVARVEMPKDKKVSISYGSNNYIVNIDENSKNAIVYARIPTNISQPSISVINFKE